MNRPFSYALGVERTELRKGKADCVLNETEPNQRTELNAMPLHFPTPEHTVYNVARNAT